MSIKRTLRKIFGKDSIYQMDKGGAVWGVEYGGNTFVVHAEAKVLGEGIKDAIISMGQSMKEQS